MSKVWKQKVLDEGKEEYSKRMSMNCLGRKMSLEAKEKIRAFQKKKVFSAETRKKISESKKGSKHHWWRGGITKKNFGERKAFMNTYEYKQWRKEVFKRDNYTCIECKMRGGELNADHIKSYSQYPELRLILENGRTLCKSCHNKIGWKGNQCTSIHTSNGYPQTVRCGS